MTAEREALEAYGRFVDAVAQEFAEKGLEQARAIFAFHLRAVSQALANPATIRDTDEDAEGRERICELIEYLDAMSQPGFVIGGRRLYTDDLRHLLASSPSAEPREASALSVVHSKTT